MRKEQKTYSWISVRRTVIALMTCFAIAACWTLVSNSLKPTPALAATSDNETPRRDGERPSPERQVRRDGDRPSPEREVRRDGDRPVRDREVSTAQLYNLVQQLRKEVAMLRMEVRRLHSLPAERSIRESDERESRDRRQELPRNPFGPRDR